MGRSALRARPFLAVWSMGVQLRSVGTVPVTCGGVSNTAVASGAALSPVPHSLPYERVAAGGAVPNEQAWRGRAVSLLFHGHYARASTKRGGCSDFFQSAHNLRAAVFAPLLARERADAGEQLMRVFVHTFSTRCAAADAALLAALRPTAFEFSRAPLPRIIDSYVRVLLLALAHTPLARHGPQLPASCLPPASLGVASARVPSRAKAAAGSARALRAASARVRPAPELERASAALSDAVETSVAAPSGEGVQGDSSEEVFVLLRFDVQHFVPLTSHVLDWRSVNVPWLDPIEANGRWRTACDHLFVLPARWATTMACALRGSASRYLSGSAHYVLRYLEKPLGCAGLRPAALVDGRFGSSLVVQRARELREMHNESIFLGIERSCAGPAVRCNATHLARFASQPAFMWRPV
ncbi:hypothetical protein KFE25_005531 [Diacronema lutheri]|uniref:Uncharacterized protein n=1 Tax=Diacronema lutheri TaxID=2081491 RepID=A0A8J5XK35_DIALT|nr:hypothetical protein KFE25_005531 [Diacronema lutheri]